MTYKIIESDDKTFYYLLEIDGDGNQKVLLEDPDLKKVQAHESIVGKKLKPIPEADTRGLVAPPEDETESETTE